MKKLMLIAAVTIASVSAHASKSRIEALQNAAHISDLRDAFNGKAEETVNYEAALVEFGGTNASPNAEGGFVRKMGDNALGFYIGKGSLTYAEQATAIADGVGTNADEDAALEAGVAQKNPIILTYGSKMGGMAWGVGLFMANADQKSFSNTQNAEVLSGKLVQNIYGVYGGVNNGTWDAQLRLGLQGETKFTADAANTVAALGTSATLKGTSTMNVKVSGGYHMDTMYFYGHYESLAGNAKINGTKVADTTSTDLTVGVINSHKKDGVDFFYGISAVSTEDKEKVSGAKVTEFKLPVIAGVEGEASSWLTLRGAISQSLPFLSTSKASGGKTNTADADTTTTIGAGIKWGKATVDTTLGMGSTGSFGFDTGNFIHSSLTYNF